jgi:hypothetical protein
VKSFLSIEIGITRAVVTYLMGSNSVPSPLPEGIKLRARERRKHPRFDMRFAVLLRVIGESWISSETIEVSATGASLVVDRPFLLNTAIEYIVTLPSDLTKAPRPIRVRFFGEVLRCERIAHDGATFGVVVSNTSHRYLSANEAAVFDELEQSRTQLRKRAG